MDIPVQPFLLSLPALIYAAMRARRGGSWRQAFIELGFTAGKPRHYLWGLAIAAFLVAFGTLALLLVPKDVLLGPGSSLAQYEGLALGLTGILVIFLREAFYVALGEEVFFRGWLGGWLFWRFGFRIGNLIQATLFTLPHLLLLLIAPSFWPLVPIWWLAGWLLGYLRHRSGSIFPGWLAHALSNTASALLVAVLWG
jgi:uncharacterized protein